MNIPTIGGARGIFEIFVPGLFLLLNFGIVAYLLPFIDQRTREMVTTVTANSILGLIVAVCFGYLIGILLRLLKTDHIDKLSSAWLKAFDKKSLEDERSREPKDKNRTFAWLKRIFNKSTRQSTKPVYKSSVTDEFPYIVWLGEVAKWYLPPEALTFYKKVWAPRDRGSNKRNKQFFNFCKVVVTSYDEKAANEIYAAEALTRYIAGMFYALMAASFLIIVTFVIVGLESEQWMTGLLFMLLPYAFAMLIIIQRFRKIRIREVEVVFAASFKNRKAFEGQDREDEKQVSE
jgi:hypothetical protein